MSSFLFCSCLNYTKFVDSVLIYLPLVFFRYLHQGVPQTFLKQFCHYTRQYLAFLVVVCLEWWQMGFQWKVEEKLTWISKHPCFSELARIFPSYCDRMKNLNINADKISFCFWLGILNSIVISSKMYLEMTIFISKWKNSKEFWRVFFQEFFLMEMEFLVYFLDNP